MSCKQKNLENLLTGFDLSSVPARRKIENVIPTSEEISKAFDDKASDDNAGTIQNWKIKEKKEKLKYSDKVSAIGKKKIIINTSSFGPQLKYRKNNLGVLPNNAKMEDKFRLTSGKYWTLTDDNESITYLNNPDDSPYSVLDWNFSGKEDPDVKDLIIREDFVENNGDLDVLIKDLGASGQFHSSTEKAFFGSQQWVLIKANRAFYSKPNTDIGKPKTSIDIAPSDPPADSTIDIASTRSVIESLFNSSTWEDFVISGLGAKSKIDTTPPVSTRDPDYYHSDDYKSKPLDPDYYHSDDYKPPKSLDPDYYHSNEYKSPTYDSQEPTKKLPLESEIKIAVPNLSLAKIYKASDIAALPLVKMIPEKVFADTVRINSTKQTHEAAITVDRDFYDHSFEMPVPFSEKEIRNYTGLVKPLVASFGTEYNFLIKDYEKILKNIQEQILPNMYVMETEMSEQTNNRDFQDLITLNNSIDIKFAPQKVKSDKGKEKSNSQQKTVSGQYFKRYARQYEKISKDTKEMIKLDPLKSKFTNIGIPMENMNILDKYDEKKHMYPMYLEAKFDTDKTTKIAEILKDSKLSTTIMKRIMSNNLLDVDVKKRSMYEITELIYRELTDIGEISTVKQYTCEKTNRRSWNITELLKDAENSNNSDALINKDVEYDIGMFLGGPSEEVKTSQLPQYKFIRALLKIIFTGKLKKIVKEEFRTLEELMSGKLAYSETVMYRVEKRLALPTGEPTGKAIQNFYFPNSNEIDVLKFVDTQVKYGTKYVYSVFAYQAVVGTKYRYSNVKTKNKLATFLVTQTPSIEMIEIPYYRFTGMVLDSPPVFPQIDIMQYKGINDKVLMWFNTNVGDYLFDPISIEPEDEIKIKELRQSRGLDPDEKLRYRTDDYSGLFQIFRLEEKPKDYKDFAGNLIAAVRTDVNERTPQEAPSAAFVDDLIPNTKYYYCFRCIDYHGNLSNPTDVYQIELVDDSGAVYMLIDIVDFFKKEKMKHKPMKKYLYIAPSVAQSQVNRRANWNKLTAADLFKNVLLGRESQSVWGRKFKFRLISKNSGKKMDLNISFDVTKKLDTKKEKQ